MNLKVEENANHFPQLNCLQQAGIISTFAKTCLPPWSVQVCKRVCLRDQECRSVIESHFSQNTRSFRVSTSTLVKGTEIPWDDLRWRQFSLAHDPRITWARATQRSQRKPAMTPGLPSHPSHPMLRPTLQQLNKEKCYWTMTKLLGSWLQN